MAHVNVLSNLKHDGTRYEAGDTVDLDDKALASLVELGVVEPAAEAKVAEEATEVVEEAATEQAGVEPAAEAKAGGKKKK